MKSWILSLAIFASSAISFANTEVSGVKSFPVTQAQMAKAHFDEEFQSGSVILNYDEKTVTLVLNRKFQCPAGAMCAMVMPAPKIVQLPIVSVESGRCGATQVSAQRDLRAQDGILEQINVIDNTTMVCRILLPYQGTATYVTSHVDRTTGEDVTLTSKMVLGGHGPTLKF